MNEKLTVPERTEYFAPLQCGLLAAWVDFQKAAVVLYLPKGHCTDMDGAIEYARTLNPRVACIVTYSGKAEDTSYLKNGGRWQAFEP